METSFCTQAQRMKGNKFALKILAVGWLQESIIKRS